MPVKSKDSKTVVKNSKKTRRILVETKVIDNKSKTKSNEIIITWSRYLHKILKQVNDDNITISTKAMTIVNHLMNDLFEKFALEVSQLVKRSNRRTIREEDIHAAVKLIIPGELCRHAIAEGQKALRKYSRSMEGE